MSVLPDGSVDDPHLSTQLALDLDIPQVLPELVVTVPTAEATRGDSRTLAIPHTLPLGPVLAQVLEFHQAFGLPRQALPTTHVGDVLEQLRVTLLREETEEFADATDKQDLVAIADALADVVYVAYGAAVTYGIDLDAVIAEVHSSNMSKLDEDGRPILREDGKVLKSQRYHPPRIESVLDGQLALFGSSVASTCAGLAGRMYG